ncbi:unnamed protein product [Caenorhabditis bovis]|uniref:Nucleolar protein 6 n=1 Tax=Caenorhabditis bovis TaxID=2654633 RepID=A0A8S1F0B9_9PELO|nr:unnamed protein product [Caenorhabditis bovis]
MVDTEDILENSANETPMSNAYRLLCEDLCAQSASDIEKEKKTMILAKKLVKAIDAAKMKHNFNYRDTDYWTIKNVKYPLERCPSAIKNTTSSVDKFEWKKPKATKIVAESTISNNIRVFVEIPDALFGNRDYLNLTYAAKRAHYACAIANLFCALKFSEIQTLTFVIENNNALYPNLKVNSQDGDVIFAFFNTAIAKNKRFIPTIGNLRPSTVFKAFDKSNECATPIFNQRFLQTIEEPKFRQNLEEKLKSAKDARIALKLICKLLHNRRLTELANIVVPMRFLRLLNQGLITDKQEILTVLRIVVKDLIQWETENVDYVEVGDSMEDEIEDGYKKAFEVSLIQNFWNCAHEIGKNEIIRLKMELASCLPNLGDVYTFDNFFIESTPIHANFDHYASLTLNAAQIRKAEARIGTDAADNNDIVRNYVGMFKKLIEKTMSERFEYFTMECIRGLDTEWSVDKYFGDVKEFKFVLGFRSTSAWSNPITIGPVAQDETAREFRALWKNVSELRKFADSRVCECVVWSLSANDDIPHRILSFITQKIIEIQGSSISWRKMDGLKSDEQEQSAVTKAFANLSATLRSLKGLPLTITNVHGISPYIRGTEPLMPSVYAAFSATNNGRNEVPIDDRIRPFTPALTVHIKLEYSGRWGNEVESIRRLTSSFYVKMAEKLRRRDLVAVATIDQLFVLQDGIVFKLVVVNEKMQNVLQEAVEKLKNAGASRIESSVEGMRLAAWKKKFITEPFLQLSLQTFATSHRFFSDAVQILKRWIGSLLLSGHIDDIILELLVVAAVTKKGFIEPQSSWTAFARTLDLIATHNWLTRPLIVDMGKSWTDDERARLEENFVKMRPILPPMVVITDEDPVGSKFTRENPSGIVLKRLIGFAGEASKILERHITGEKLVDFQESLLKSDYSPYDAIINLNSDAVVRKSTSFKRNAKAKTIPVVELDPIDELVYQLNNNFHQVAMFFYNKYGGESIGVKFKPHEEQVPAKIAKCLLHKSVSDAILTLNKEEIMEDIRIMGQGIVADVQLIKS